MIVTTDMVERFLRWPLPYSVCADLIATRAGDYYDPPRVGTNLLTFDEARQMLEFVLKENPPSQMGKPGAVEHTKGPWRYRVNVGPTKGLLVEEDGSTILELANSTRSSRFERDIRRIVACVNACEGLPIEELERYAAHAPYTAYTDLRTERDVLSAQVKDLREALEAVVDSVTPKAEREAIDSARALLAKAPA